MAMLDDERGIGMAGSRGRAARRGAGAGKVRQLDQTAVRGSLHAASSHAASSSSRLSSSAHASGSAHASAGASADHVSASASSRGSQSVDSNASKRQRR
jgi:hypothetical protein